MKRQAHVSGTAVLALALAACQGVPPDFLVPHYAKGPIDKTMDCPQVALAIDRAETIRWLCREDGGKLATRSEQRWSNFAFSKHVPLDFADSRLRDLLRLKRAHGCPPRATALPGMDDFVLLRQLEAVQVQLDAGSGAEVELLKERTRLLDGLRIVPTPETVPSAEINRGPWKDNKAPGTQ